MSSSLHKRSEILWASLFLFISFLFVGYYFFLRNDLSRWETKKTLEVAALEKIRQDQQQLYSPETRKLMEEFSQTLDGVEGILKSREEVFSVDQDSTRLDPIVVLDLVDFLNDLRKRLSRSVVINNVSLSPSGKLSFFVQALSYREAARQIELFEQGIALSDSDEDLLRPPLFTQMQVGSVTKTSLLLSELEKLPPLLKGKEASYDFLLQMQINPAFFVPQVGVDLHDSQELSNES